MGSIKSFPNNRDEYVGAEYAMRWLHGRTSGVFAANNNAAVAAVQNSMAVTVSDGLGWITDAENNGVVWWNDTEKTSGAKIQLTVDAADGVLNRIDRVIVEWKTTDYADLPELKILKGTPASTAAAPALTNNTTVRQLSLAQISIAAGTTAITAAMITDERLNNSVCGLVTESVTADTSVINAQFTALLAQFREAIAQAVAGTIPEHSITLLMLAEEVTAIALGGVATVNSKSPDEAGNVGIVAGDIPYTSGSESTVKSVLDGKQSATSGLSASTDVADGDYFPFFDTSASANKKTLWSNIVSKIRSALFGTLNGFLKANGSGTLSAVSTVPVANGGTGGTTAATARSNLGITPANIGAIATTAGAVGTSNLGDKVVTAAKLAADAVKLTFTNKSVAASAFVSNSTYSDFPYRAAVTLTGVTAAMIPEVFFGLTDAMSGNFAPVAESYAGGIYIYAAAKPSATITIPTILCWR
nr:MAG TPA: Receptor Binding Protein [Caudoviricetes sp.]